MAQTVFAPELDAFCRRNLVEVKGVAPPDPIDLTTGLVKQFESIFENLLLFDRISIKITGESIPIAVLLNSFGQKSLESLIEQEAIEFVLWNQAIVHFVENIPGVNTLGSMRYNNPEHNDPERSIDSGLRWWKEAPTGRRRRQLIRRLVPLFRFPEKDLSETATKVVTSSLQSGDMQHYGIPAIAGYVDNLTPAQKHIVIKCADDFAEYDFLLKNDMTSFSNYQYFSPFWATAQRFQTMNRTVMGFSAISKLEGIPDLKEYFREIEEPLKKVVEIRKTRNAVHFREWLEKTAGESPDPQMVKEYLAAISGDRKNAGATSRKLVKAVMMAAVGVGVGSVFGAQAGVYVGALAGAGASIATAAAEKITELATETGLGMFDSVVLERVTKGRSPRMFFDDLSRLPKIANHS